MVRQPVTARTLAFSLGLTLLATNRSATPQESLSRKQPLTLFLGGDVLPGRGVAPRWNTVRTPLHFFAPFSKNADIAFCNLEGALLIGNNRQKPHFQLEALQGLGATGFDVVSLANNHTLDAGAIGLQATVQKLDALGIRAVGGALGGTSAPTADCRQVEVKGVTFLAATQYGPHHAGNVHLVPLDEALVERVRAAAVRGPVVVSLHWGVEGRANPSPWQRDFAHRLIDVGARVVVGHHPHVAGPVESYRGRPIFYSLGNFVWDTMPPRAMPVAQSGLVVQVRFVPDGTITWKTWPIVPTDAGPPTPKGETRLRTVSGLFTGMDAPEQVVWSRDSTGRNHLRAWKWTGATWVIAAQSVAGNLTRIEAGDVDGDGRDELLVEVRQGAKLESQILPRLQVYRAAAMRGFVPYWRGSHLSRPFLNWMTFPNPEGRGVGVLACEVNSEPQWKGRQWLALYRWNGFGFRLVWELSVRGQVQQLRSGSNSKGTFATFTQVNEGRTKKWRLRPVINSDGTEKLYAEPA